MGSQYNNEGFKAFTTAEAIGAHLRVKLSSGAITVEKAGAGEAAIGVTEHAAGSGEVVTVRLTNCPGTVRIVANDTFAVAATLYGAAGGEVSDSASGTAYYYALEACTTALDVIECLPIV
jgi:hypothetical protein